MAFGLVWGTKFWLYFTAFYILIPSNLYYILNV